MNHQIFHRESYRNQIRRRDYLLESLYLIGLFLAALLLLSFNLKGLPLQDWDEAIVAQVAKDIASEPLPRLTWIFPAFEDKPLINQFPLIPNLIALSYALAGVNEWTTRFPVVFLTAISIPCLYTLSREIFVRRRTALFAALIYLTFLPVLRYGRLAMFDGGVLCLVLLMFCCLLRSRRDWRWSLGLGLAWSLLCLHQGLIGVACGAIACLFLAWDTPRLLQSSYPRYGLCLGLVPLIFWYLAQGFNYGREFSTTFFHNFAQVLTQYNVAPWYYLQELIKYSFPWLLFAVYGLKLAWKNSHWSWAKLIIVWSSSYFLYISLIATKFPQYLLPIYPVLALAAAAKLEQILELPSHISYPRSWSIILGLLAIVATVSSLCLSLTTGIDYSLIIILNSLALTMAISGLLISRREAEFIPQILWGMYVSLLLLMSSSHWLGEIKETEPVKPVAAIIRLNTPNDAVVFSSFNYTRPALNFYSERPVLPSTKEQIIQRWQQIPGAYFLLDTDTLQEINLEDTKILAQAPPHWLLITRISD